MQLRCCTGCVWQQAKREVRKFVDKMVTGKEAWADVQRMKQTTGLSHHGLSLSCYYSLSKHVIFAPSMAFYQFYLKSHLFHILYFMHWCSCYYDRHWTFWPLLLLTFFSLSCLVTCNLLSHLASSFMLSVQILWVCCGLGLLPHFPFFLTSDLKLNLK